MKKIKISRKEISEIVEQVPVDYYQTGTKSNLLQRAWHFGKLNAVTSLIPGKPHSIIDIGCASGWFASQIALRHPNAHVVGVDIYGAAIKYGRSQYSNITFRVADAHALPFKSHSFELVMSCEVLEHLADPKKALQELRRILKKDGHAIIEMDTGNALFRFVWYWWTHARHGVWKDAHIQVFNEEILEHLIQTTQLKIIKKVRFNFGMAVCFLVTPL